ncbi:hypothetical protein [Marinobacter nauticus]|uniref:hypothetical protein n=1 Tax=Marinobacter nauticus TaxID=2743 RepID=UPI0035163D4E
MINQEFLDDRVYRIGSLIESIVKNATDEEKKAIKGNVNSANSAKQKIYEGIANNAPIKDIFLLAIGYCKRSRSLAERVLSINTQNLEQKSLASLLMKTSDELNEYLDSKKDSLDIELASDLEARNTESSKLEINSLLSKINAAQNQSQQATADINNRINDLRKDLSSVSTSAEKMESDLREAFDRADRIFDEKLANLKEKEEQASELLEIISRDTISGSFQNAAAEERAMANTLRAMSLVCMGIMAFVMFITLWQSTTEPLATGSLVLRLAFVTIVSIPAAYLARESSRHRELEHSQHRIALELKSVDPYLATMPDEMKNKIKETLAYKIFSGPNEMERNENKTPISSHELMEKILEKLTK